MPKIEETVQESKKQLTPWQKRGTLVGRIGRVLCVMLILLVCGNVTYNVFRLLDSFQEKEPPPVADDENIAMLPLITFDPEGGWELSGLSTVKALQLMPMPETVTMLGSRNDRAGNPLMQLYEYHPADSDISPENRVQSLLDYWAQQGWKSRSLNIFLPVSYMCESGHDRYYVQFLPDDAKYYFLVSHTPHDP